MQRINNKGFTLIELLIVIVIIGILAGVLIAVIDPTTQQNRARDANVRATMNKIALATNGYISAYGRAPNETEFQGGINGFQAFGVDCLDADEADCVFDIQNSPLARVPNGKCGVDNVSGLGVNDCYYFYCGDADLTPDFNDTCVWTDAPAGPTLYYRLFAKAYGSENMFMYNSRTSTMYLCDTDGLECQNY